MSRLFAVSDLHLSVNNPKPMNVFGHQWDNYWEKIVADWRARVSAEDIVLIAGDISWAMYLPNAVPDLRLIGELPGRKVILRGNHDYWWKTISSVRAVLPAGMFAVQNDALKLDNYIICGSRLWTVPEIAGVYPSDEDKKIYLRETERLKLSLNAAQRIREEGDMLICMAHYPPFNARRADSDYTALMRDARADVCVYGHLHGVRGAPLTAEKDGITYRLTSCDMLGNKLALIAAPPSPS